MIKKIDTSLVHARKHARVRKKVSGSESRPRLTVHFSNGHIRAQIIDDIKGHTLVSSSTIQLKINGSNVANAILVGKDLATKALQANIDTVVFDRSGYTYHGKVEALANASREAGLKF